MNFQFYFSLLGLGVFSWLLYDSKKNSDEDSNNNNNTNPPAEGTFAQQNNGGVSPVVLLSSTLTSFLNQNPKAVVLFYASWCPACKKFLPTFTKLANYSSFTSAGIKFGMIECSSNSLSCSNFGVSSYPTTIFFKNRNQFKSSVGAIDFQTMRSTISNSFN